MEGVYLDGKPIAVVGSKCVCTGSGKENSIVKGCDGILVDGKPIAIVGSTTEHGGIMINGNPGITVTGSFAQAQGDKAKSEPRIFNLQWRDGENIVKYGEFENSVILSADTIGYEDGEEIPFKIYKDGSDEIIDEVVGIVKNGRVEAEWIPKKEQQ